MPLIDIVLQIIGVIGVGLVIGAYFLLQRDVFTAHDLRYLSLNLTGSAFIGVSLIHDWNLPAFLIEVVWVVISLYGIAKVLQDRKKVTHSD